MRKTVCFIALLLLQIPVLSAQDYPVDTVDMSDYRILPFDSLDLEKMEMRTVLLDWDKEWHLIKVLRAWNRLYVLYEWYDYSIKRHIPEIEIFDESGAHLGRLGYTRDELPEIRRTNYVEVVNEGAPDYSQTYLSVADMFWNGSEIFVADSAGRKVLCYDHDGNLVRRRHVDFPIESIVPLANCGYLLGIGGDTPYSLPEKEVVAMDWNLSEESLVLFPRPGVERKMYVGVPKFQNVAEGYMVNSVHPPRVYLLDRFDGHIVKEYRLDLDVKALSEYENLYLRSPVVIGDRYACGLMERVWAMPDDEYANGETSNFIVDQDTHTLYLMGLFDGFADRWDFVTFLGYDRDELIFLASPIDRPYPENEIIFMTLPL